MRTFVALLAILASSVSAAAAQPAQRCSAETFPVGGQAVRVTVCGTAAAGGASVPVTETVKSGAKSFEHQTTIDVLEGAVSRTVDDLSLTSIGLPYTLHLTLAYRQGAVSIEHALLLPGAIPLK